MEEENRGATNGEVNWFYVAKDPESRHYYYTETDARERIEALRREALRAGPRGIIGTRFLAYRSRLWAWVRRLYRSRYGAR